LTTALIAALLLVALGVAAKGLIVQTLVVVGAWLIKNVLMLGFLQTPPGKRASRAVRGGTYSALGEKGRRKAFRLFNLLARLENSAITIIRRAIPSSPSYGAGDRPSPRKNGVVPVENMLAGMLRLGKDGFLAVSRPFSRSTTARKSPPVQTVSSSEAQDEKSAA